MVTLQMSFRKKNALYALMWISEGKTVKCVTIYYFDIYWLGIYLNLILGLQS